MRIFVASIGTAPHHLLLREHFHALSAADAVGTHQATASAAEADIVLFVDLQQHPQDVFLRALRRHPLTLAYPEKVCVYDERDDPFVSFPGIYVAGTPDLARRQSITGGPYPWLQTIIPRSEAAPDLLFSFNGARTHPVRSAILDLEHPRGRVTDTTGLSFFAWSADRDGRSTDDARRNYVDTVIRSKFVLCPRGHGPSSFRLYETLSAGRVPVVVSDDWLPPPRVAWDACVVRVAECDVAGLARVLEDLEPAWPRMADTAARTFDTHFARSRLWDHYASSLCDLLPASRPRRWWAQREVLRLTARRARGVLRDIVREQPDRASRRAAMHRLL